MRELRGIIKFHFIYGVTIKVHKKSIAERKFHTVIEYDISFISKRKSKLKRVLFDETVFCTAHSDEPRKNISTLKFLRSNRFSKGLYVVPNPLFYSKFFKGSFYTGAKGYDLYFFIKSKDKKRIEKVVKQIAGWLTKLHMLQIESIVLFNKSLSNQFERRVYAKIKSKLTKN
jgi:hypothetical protein